MSHGDPKARAVQFFLDVPNVVRASAARRRRPAPADIDGTQKPKDGRRDPIVGTQDDGGRLRRDLRRAEHLGLDVKWNANPRRRSRCRATADGRVRLDLPVRADRSRDCLPQPGITNPNQYLDILSYRQRPTWRLAYRNFKELRDAGHEPVGRGGARASPACAGTRSGAANGAYSIYQQGTYAPADGVHRWMGSIAQDKKGNMALGYSVVNGTTSSRDPLHGPPRRRRARTDDARRGHDHRRHRRPDDDELPLGRLHVDEHRPDRRLHVLVRQRVLHAGGPGDSTAGWQTRIGSVQSPWLYFTLGGDSRFYWPARGMPRAGRIFCPCHSGGGPPASPGLVEGLAPRRQRTHPHAPEKASSRQPDERAGGGIRVVRVTRTPPPRR